MESVEEVNEGFIGCISHRIVRDLECWDRTVMISSLLKPSQSLSSISFDVIFGAIPAIGWIGVCCLFLPVSLFYWLYLPVIAVVLMASFSVIYATFFSKFINASKRKFLMRSIILGILLSCLVIILLFTQNVFNDAWLIALSLVSLSIVGAKQVFMLSRATSEVHP